MAQIQLTNPTFYKNGEAGHSEVVGFESGVTRVARYAFVTPASGATSLSFRLENVSFEAGTLIPIRFALTTDPEAHCNAGENAPYQGTVALSGITATGEAALRLAPSTTYYLWFFPGRNVWGWYYFPFDGTVELTGVAEGVPSVEGEYCLGDTIPIAISSSPQYTHRLTWNFAGVSGTIGEDLGDSASWTPPVTLAQHIPNHPSAICTVTCYTYENGSPIGSPQSVSFPLRVPQSIAPLVSGSFWDMTDAHAALGVYLGKISRLSVTVEATAYYGATLVATGVLLDDIAYGGGTLQPGAHILTVTATDSRGLTGRAEYPITVASYEIPQLELHASRCLSDGTPDDTGNYAIVTLTGSTTELSGNTAALTLTYGLESVEIPVAVGSFTETRVIPAAGDMTLPLEATLTDAIRTVSRSMTLSTAYATMDFLYGGKGIAFGAVARSEGFYCAMDARFMGRVTDAQGRELVSLQPLEPADGIELRYGRVLWLLDTATLQLQFRCDAELPQGTLLTDSFLSAEKTISDTTCQFPLRLTPTGIYTAATLPPGTYTFHCPLC